MQTLDIIRGKYVLPVSVAIDVPAGFPRVSTEYMLTRGEGRKRQLVFLKGMPWDGPTGGLDTDSMMIPSLVHDGFCILTTEGHISRDLWREFGDELFRDLIKANISGRFQWFKRFRAQYSFRAVRIWSESRFSKGGTDMTRTVPCNGVHILEN